MTIHTSLEKFRNATARTGRRAWSAVRAHPWLSLGLLPAAVVVYVLVLIPFTPSIGDIRKAKQEYPTVVMSADGKELAMYKRANRDWVKMTEISPLVVDALIATEDRRFFEHHGLDFVRTSRALVNTLAGDRQGGSTISQQLARNLYPDEVGRAPTITRKVKEAITAFKLEAIYTKEEILETYLNTVPFLYNAFGIEMAARTYFDKPAAKLDVTEAATLVGMLKGTSYYNPVLAPERSIERRNTVLAQMVKYGKLDSAQYEQVKGRPLGVDFERQPEVTGPAPHMARQLRQWLVDWADRKGYNIYADGLVVRTTIDSRVQAYANEAVKKHMDKLQGNADARRNALRGNKALVDAFVRDTAQFRELRAAGRSEAEALKQLQGDAKFMQDMWEDKTQLQAGFMAMEPGSGYVRAWVGSRDFNKDQFDHVQQARRQPGSTFKPFVYGAAFEAGMNPMEQLMDGPVEIRIDERTTWRPTDVDGFTNQPMTLREGLAKSKNTITAQLMQRVGPQRVAQLAQAMGVRQSKLDVVPALALGTSPVTLKEMVAAYGTIANNGSYVEPALVTRVEDREGNVLEEFGPAAPQNALSQDAAQTLLDVMRAVIDEGTAVRIRATYNLKADVAGKTGTTQNDTDGWFVMMHPQLVGGAWVGFNDARVTMQHEWGQGSRSALPIVGEVFQKSLATKVIDGNSQFAAPRNKGMQDPSLLGRVNDWLGGIFASGSTAPAVQNPEVVIAPQVPLPQMPSASLSEPAPRAPDASVAMPQTYGTELGSGSGSSSVSGTQSAGSASGGGLSILSLGLPTGRSNALPPAAGAPPIAPAPAIATIPAPATGLPSTSYEARSRESSQARVVTLPSGAGMSQTPMGAGGGAVGGGSINAGRGSYETGTSLRGSATSSSTSSNMATGGTVGGSGTRTITIRSNPPAVATTDSTSTMGSPPTRIAIEPSRPTPASGQATDSSLPSFPGASSGVSQSTGSATAVPVSD
ncbi:penicillin-binding protein 1A [Ramlibacter sp.]|uniref:penicillin-binding protein 1A n=1 Tax=Ramlibacter sp. TaxID=1917967 RepID=UPI003D11A3FC